MKNEVKGGLVINQLKRYAKRLSDHTGDYVSINIDVVSFDGEYNSLDSVKFKIWNAAEREFMGPVYKTEDIREIGRLIDAFIENDKRRSENVGK